LEKQLILKRVIAAEEASDLLQNIRFDFQKDNFFTELKEAEINSNRLAILGQIDPFVGRYYSSTWVKKNVLRQNDEDIEKMQLEMDEDEINGFPTQTMMAGMAGAPPPMGMQQGMPDMGGSPPDQQQTGQGNQDITSKEGNG
jgi:hypothetical protein